MFLKPTGDFLFFLSFEFSRTPTCFLDVLMFHPFFFWIQAAWVTDFREQAYAVLGGRQQTLLHPALGRGSCVKQIRCWSFSTRDRVGFCIETCVE